MEPGAQAFLRGRPDDIAILVDQTDGGNRLVAPLGRVIGFVIADPQSGGAALAVIPGARAVAEVEMGVDAVGRLMRFGKPARLLMMMSRICAAVSPPVSRST
jgi:hypothetical protein